MDAYSTVNYAPTPLVPYPPTAPGGLPGPYLMRLRTGLGLAVVCTALSYLMAIVVLATGFSHPETLTRPNYIGGIIWLGCLVGWWVFATPVPGRGGVAWMVRLALLLMTASVVHSLINPPTATPPTFSFATFAWGAVSFAASIMQFYGTLVIIQRVGVAMGDAWMQRHAVVCMIALPVLFLLGIVGMTMFVVYTMAGLAQSSLSPGAAPTPPEFPVGVVFGVVMTLMGGAGLWYLVFLGRVWGRLMRVG